MFQGYQLFVYMLYKYQHLFSLVKSSVFSKLGKLTYVLIHISVRILIKLHIKCSFIRINKLCNVYCIVLSKLHSFSYHKNALFKRLWLPSYELVHGMFYGLNFIDLHCHKIFLLLFSEDAFISLLLLVL